MRFESRADAGRRLAAALSAYTGKPIVLALPRGGVPVAAVVAAALNAPLDLVLVRASRIVAYTSIDGAWHARRQRRRRAS